jgi:hypothetical protein
LIDNVRDPQGGWTYPVVCAFDGQSAVADTQTYERFNDSSSNVRGVHPAGSPSFFLTCEGYGTAMLGQPPAGDVADSQTSGWIMCPIGLFSETTGVVGRKGTLYDLWWGSVTRSTGDTYPSDGSYQFAQFGDMVFPWSGVLPEVA